MILSRETKGTYSSLILSKKSFFKISDLSPQKIDFKNQDDTIVIFQALQTSAASLTSTASATSLASTRPQQPLQPYYLKKLPGPDGLVITGTKVTNTGYFLKNGSSKI